MAIGAGCAFALTRTYLFDLAPIALVLAVLLGVLAGEAVTPRLAHGHGAASLVPRRVRDYVSKGDLVTTAVLGGGIVVFTRFPAPDPPDHQVKYFSAVPPVSLDSTLITLGGTVTLTAVAVWLVVRSPRAGASEADDAWRQATVRRLVHTCAAVFAIVFTALAFWYADDQWDWRGGGSPQWGMLLSLLAGLGLTIFARYAGTLANSQPDPRAPAVASAPDRTDAQSAVR
jgi:hypothetical protein